MSFLQKTKLLLTKTQFDPLKNLHSMLNLKSVIQVILYKFNLCFTIPKSIIHVYCLVSRNGTIDILINFCIQAAWCLKTRALTEQVYVDEIEVDEEGIAEVLMDDNSMAQLPS